MRAWESTHMQRVLPFFYTSKKQLSKMEVNKSMFMCALCMMCVCVGYPTFRSLTEKQTLCVLLREGDVER